jgi:S1-C subfamily serine protease
MRLIVVALVCLMGADLYATDWATVIATAKPFVVRVTAQFSNNVGQKCSGIVLDADQGIYATNAHCVQRSDGGTLAGLVVNDRHATVLSVNIVVDLAVLKGSAKNVQNAPLAPANPRIGDAIAVLGHPISDPELNAQVGIISRDTGQFMRHDALLLAGDSGGPLVDASGRVVGINRGYEGDGRVYFGTAIAIANLRDFAKDYLPKVKP